MATEPPPREVVLSGGGYREIRANKNREWSTPYLDTHSWERISPRRLLEVLDEAYQRPTFRAAARYASRSKEEVITPVIESGATDYPSRSLVDMVRLAMALGQSVDQTVVRVARSSLRDVVGRTSRTAEWVGRFDAALATVDQEFASGSASGLAAKATRAEALNAASRIVDDVFGTQSRTAFRTAAVTATDQLNAITAQLRAPST